MNPDVYTYLEGLPLDRWEEYKALKLQAVTEAPGAFSPSIEDLSKQSEDQWKELLRKTQDGEHILVFAEYEGILVGIAGVYLYTKERFKHNASLDSLYVLPSHRGRGIAQELTRRRLDMLAKRSEITNIFCEIFSSQTESIKLHKKLGFEVTGCIKNFVKTGDQYYDCVFMSKKV